MPQTNIIKNKYVLIASATVWLMVAMVSISESVFFYKLSNKPVPWDRVLIWDMNWLLWLIITPFILNVLFYLLEHHQKLYLTIGKITLFAFIVAFLHILVESTLSFWLSPLFGRVRSFNQVFFSILTYKTHLNLLILAALTGITIALRHWQKSQRLQLNAKQQQAALHDLQRQLAESKLELLRRQLKPHFLFNTLHVISGLILKKAYDQSLEMIAKLSDLLRLTLQYNDQQLIPLKEELKLVQLYLEIHQIRFGDRFHLDIATPPLYEDVLVPSFILQPIAENAVIHGIVPNMNQGCISLQVNHDAETLYIQVKDDGVGPKHGEALKEGIGLKNCRERLDNLYQKPHGLKLEGQPNGGFTTTLYLPYQKAAG
ncbi:MAG TPA: hypothetical protein DCS93_41445 [Microscillaceae bacterium]|nr:hypothetical protein [Microscillaceae bacterium]